jgi:hypothetical protein
LRRFLSIFFLVVIITQSFGLLLYYETNQAILKFSRLERINLENKTTLVLSFDEYIHSLKEENEISYNQKMYDVIERTFIKEKVKIICVKDLKEDHLLKSILGLFNPKNKKEENTLSKIFKLIKLSFVDTIYKLNFITEFSPKDEIIYLFKEYFYFTSIANPPPNHTS